MRHWLALWLLFVPSLSLGAGDWAEVHTTLLEPAARIRTFEFRADSAETSADLDLRACKSGVTVRWDGSVNDSSQTARAHLFECPNAGAALSECRRVGNFAADDWSDLPGPGAQNAVASSGGFFRVRIAVAPTGGDISSLQLRCVEAEEQRESGDLALLRSELNHTEIPFQHLIDTACANALCTPNDSLTPTWIRNTDIGTPVSPTFALDSTWGTSGEAILDPGTSASTGVQISLPATQSAVLLFQGGHGQARHVLFRGTFWRSGTTVIPAIGLCPTSSANAANALLTTAGAFPAVDLLAAKWDAAGTISIKSGATTITTTETYDSIDYHELVIRSVRRNIALDATGNMLPMGTVDDALLVEIDGVPQHTIPFSGTPILLTTLQLTPCMAAVNVGGTADVFHIADIDWFTDKTRPLADTN